MRKNANTRITESLLCTAEINTALSINYISIFKSFLFLKRKKDILKHPQFAFVFRQVFAYPAPKSCFFIFFLQNPGEKDVTFFLVHLLPHVIQMLILLNRDLNICGKMHQPRCWNPVPMWTTFE